MKPLSPSTETTISVTALTARIKECLEQGFHTLRVGGEVSRLSRASSGHLYFTIKDAHAAISAVVWRNTVSRLSLQPEDGEAYIFSGHISVYEPRGSYQLVVTQIEPAGTGQLAAELERRKQAFAERGWFDPTRKRPIPPLPRHIGIVTSPTAAALQDVLKVLSSRPGWLRLTLSPCLVQGQTAAPSIAEALQKLWQQPGIDTILLVRGGGSMEDLWCFNDEAVVQAVVNSPIPVISGVGHEIDSTLVDFAADLRAATPSNAAELCCPSREILRRQLPDIVQMQHQLSRHMAQLRQHANHQHTKLHLRVTHQLDDRHHHLARQHQQLHHQVERGITRQRQLLQQLHKRLQQREPGSRLRQQRQQWHAMRLRLNTSAQQQWQGLHHHHRKCWQRLSLIPYQLNRTRQHWQQANDKLHSMNPLHVLQRGYTLVQNHDGHIVSSVASLQTEQSIRIRFHDGTAGASIEHIQSR